MVHILEKNKGDNMEEEQKITDEKSKDKKKLPRWKKVVIALSSVFVAGIASGLFLLYGPWPYVRETLITTAMTTMSHQYLAKWFYSDETINKVLSKHKVIESGESTNPDLIEMEDHTGNSTMYESKYEEQILKKDSDNDDSKINKDKNNKPTNSDKKDDLEDNKKEDEKPQNPSTPEEPEVEVGEQPTE